MTMRSPNDSLWSRECEFLGQHVDSVSTKEIVRALAIAETTVKIHVQLILPKPILNSRVQSAVTAVERY